MAQTKASVICCIFRPVFGCCALQMLAELVIFAKICCNFLAFLAFCSKNAENDYLDHVWSVQHPNAGRNIQQSFTLTYIVWFAPKISYGLLITQYSPLNFLLAQKVHWSLCLIVLRFKSGQYLIRQKNVSTKDKWISN